MALYMHTLDGRPAAFFHRDGVCFTNKRIQLATSLRQIRREQEQSRKMRADEGLSDEYQYGYVTVVASSRSENLKLSVHRAELAGHLRCFVAIMKGRTEGMTPTVENLCKESEASMRKMKLA